MLSEDNFDGSLKKNVQSGLSKGLKSVFKFLFLE
jgi:hypothetical protein